MAHPLGSGLPQKQPPNRETAHGLRQQLRRVAIETGLALADRDGWADTESRWLARRGLTFHTLEP
jgi:hypothetical protein